MDFPLYNTMANEAGNKKLTVAQRREFLKNVQKLDSVGMERVYLLIKHHYDSTRERSGEAELTNLKTPYDGEYTDGGITFDLEKLPQRLQQIIHHFAKKHLKISKE